MVRRAPGAFLNGFAATENIHGTAPSVSSCKLLGSSLGRCKQIKDLAESLYNIHRSVRSIQGLFKCLFSKKIYATEQINSSLAYIGLFFSCCNYIFLGFPLKMAS